MTEGKSGFEVVTTRGGARAVLDHETGEVMHPVVGPEVESRELYVKPSRLLARLLDVRGEGQGPLVLFDVGLGAASNAVAAWRVSEGLTKTARRLEIVSFDQTLEAARLALSEENAAAFGLDGPAGEAARRVIANGSHATGRTTWRFVSGDLPGTLAEASTLADIVFWDPFSPRKNASLWSVAAFRALRACCREGTTVHTYSCSTAVRSAMLLAGFFVGIGGAIGAKSTTTVAATRPGDLGRIIDRGWLDRLRLSGAPFPADAPADALPLIEQHPQFAQVSRAPAGSVP